MFLGSIVQLLTNLYTKYVGEREILLTDWNIYIMLKITNYKTKLHQVSLFLQSSCRGEADCVDLHLLRFLPDTAARQLLGHGLSELGVGHSVHQGVETARQLGCDSQCGQCSQEVIITAEYSTLSARGWER